MEFRRARLRDLDGIADLLTNGWGGPHGKVMPSASFLEGAGPQSLVKGLAGRGADRCILVAADLDRIVGFICVVADDDPGWGALIDNVQVSAASQSKGVGSGLMAQAALWLSDSRPCSPIYSWVTQKNLAGRCFYEALGGRNVESLVSAQGSGDAAFQCRYVWSTPAAIVQAVKNNQALAMRALRPAAAVTASRGRDASRLDQTTDRD